MSVLRGRIYNRRKKARGGDVKSKAAKSKGQNELLISTAEQVAKETGVSACETAVCLLRSNFTGLFPVMSVLVPCRFLASAAKYGSSSTPGGGTVGGQAGEYAAGRR
jgi:hypothetical protein